MITVLVVEAQPLQRFGFRMLRVNGIRIASN
jgi:hypothetical protein